LLAATRELFHNLGHADGRRIAQLLLERCPACDRARVEVLITAGILAMVTANAEASLAFHREAQELSAELGEDELEGFATFYHGLTQTLNMAVEPARADLEAATTLHRRAGNRAGEGLAIATLGLTYLMTGEPDRARELLNEALAIQTAAGYLWGEGHASLYLGLTFDASDPQAATKHYRRAVQCLQPYRDTNLLPNALIGQAGIVAHRDPAAALRVAAAARSLRTRDGGDFPAFFRERMRRVRETLRGRPRRRRRADLDRRYALRDRRRDRARVRDTTTARGRSRRSECPRARGCPLGRRRPRKQGDRRPAALVSPNGREPCPPRARQGWADQPHAAGHVGARAHSVAAQ
jgi:tetratricopeptide (TPR) repeat protein